MKIDILTLFPEFFKSPFSVSMMKRAVVEKIIELDIHQIRDFGLGKRKQVDDTPYGGGAGLVMKPEVITAAWESIPKNENSITLYMSPRGKVFDQKQAVELSSCQHIIVVCGHYEGVDQRFLDLSGAVEISVGDYILTGGETAALSLVNSTVRLLSGVVGNELSCWNESFSNSLLEHDHYTMPREFRDMKVPKVLLSGDHAKIEKWRLKNSLVKTSSVRPDLISKVAPSFWEEME